MSFNWAEYLSVAETLCGQQVSGPLAGIDAHHRSGVSRAYYAAFVAARNRLRDVGKVPIPRQGNLHQFVAARYQTAPDPRRRQIGIELVRLRVDRNTCDYDDVVNALPKISRRSLVRAARILNDLGQL